MPAFLGKHMSALGVEPCVVYQSDRGTLANGSIAAGVTQHRLQYFTRALNDTYSLNGTAFWTRPSTPHRHRHRAPKLANSRSGFLRLGSGPSDGFIHAKPNSATQRHSRVILVRGLWCGILQIQSRQRHKPGSLNQM